MKNAIIIIHIIFVAYVCEAKDLLNVCVPLKSYIDNNEPANFSTTNNLLRKSGTNPLYCGQKILLDLLVVDKNCVPISDAKVYLWQVGCDKKYPYHPLRKRVDKNLFQAELGLASGSTFRGSGIATTNNLGTAKFITIYPPSTTHEGPHVNLRVEHKDLGVFQTKIFLKNHDLIESDDYEIINVRIVTPWENVFRRY